MKLVKAAGTNMHDWYRTMLLRLIRMTRRASMKYTRSKVRKSIDPAFAYIIEELNIDPKDPKKADRDRFVLSKGHTAPGYYSTPVSYTHLCG